MAYIFELCDRNYSGIENWDISYVRNMRKMFYKAKNFNQDLNKNVLLLELGGNYNTIDEVLNTIDALALSIKELLYEGN